MPNTEEEADLVSRPIWSGLVGSDGSGPYLVGGKCSACGLVTLSLREICPECWAKGTMTEMPIGRRGTLYTYTVMHQLPHGYDEPFAVGYIDLEDDVRVFAHVENAPENLTIGVELELTVVALRKDDDGIELTGPRYRASQKGDGA